MMGCCSLPSLDEREGLAVYGTLKNCLVEAELMTVATEGYRLSLDGGGATTADSSAALRNDNKKDEARAPKLLRAYLAIGAKICSAPAIDREFKTIDFLTLLDLQTLHPRVAARFLA
jgi:putative hemolysin